MAGDEPLSRSRRGGRVAAIARPVDASFLVVRGSDLTRLMVTLGIGLMLWEAANKARSITGGVDGLSGVDDRTGSSACWASTSAARTAYVYCAGRRFRRVLSSSAASSIAVRAEPARHPRRRQADAGDRRAGARKRLGRSSRSAPPSPASPGALLAQTTQFVGIDSLGFPRSAELLIMLVLGGTGRLYGGARRRGDLHDRAGLPVRHRPGVLAILDGASPGRHRPVRARRHPRRGAGLRRRCGSAWQAGRQRILPRGSARRMGAWPQA